MIVVAKLLHCLYCLCRLDWYVGVGRVTSLTWVTRLPERLSLSLHTGSEREIFLEEQYKDAEK